MGFSWLIPVVEDFLIGAGTSAAVDAITGQPVTGRSLLEGGAMGDIGGAVAGGFAPSPTAVAPVSSADWTSALADVSAGTEPAISSAGTAISSDVANTLTGAGLSDTLSMGVGQAGAGVGESTLAPVGTTAAGAMPQVTVTAPAGGGGGIPAPSTGNIGAGLAGAAGTGGVSSTLPPSLQSQGQSSETSGNTAFLAASPETTPLTPEMGTSLGIDMAPSAATIGDVTGMDLTVPDIWQQGLSYATPDVTQPDLSAFALPQSPLESVGISDANLMGTEGAGSSWESWFTNPKNLATLGLLGVGGMNLLHPPKLPGAAQTALGAAGPAVQSATNIIQSGGTATPIWTQQKASIDASIDQQIQQQTEAIMQAAANSGMQPVFAPGPNGQPVPTGIVAQQIATMKANLNVQREQLYAQAQQQNVNNAVAELTAANQTLMGISQEQLALDEQSRQTAAETARLAIMLQSLG